MTMTKNRNRHALLVRTFIAVLLALAGSQLFTATGASAATAQDLLNNSRVTLTAAARGDLQAGKVDGRVIDILADLARSHTFSISVFVTGHSKYTASGNVSNHWYGRAADISVVDGKSVASGNAGARSLAQKVRDRGDS